MSMQERSGEPTSSESALAQHATRNSSSADEDDTREEEEEEDEEEIPTLNLPFTIVLLVGVTVVVGVTAEVSSSATRRLLAGLDVLRNLQWLVDSISGLTAAHPSLSQEFVGLVRLRPDRSRRHRSLRFSLLRSCSPSSAMPLSTSRHWLPLAKVRSRFFTCLPFKSLTSGE